MLCDFIHDKAKRLFTKYENAVRDRKASKDDSVDYYRRKASTLE